MGIEIPDGIMFYIDGVDKVTGNKIRHSFCFMHAAKLAVQENIHIKLEFRDKYDCSCDICCGATKEEDVTN